MARGITQAELERLAGLSHNTASRIERGEVSPRLETVEKIATAMELSVEELTFRIPSNVLKEDTVPYGKDELSHLIGRLKELPLKKREKLIAVWASLLELAESE